MNQEIVNQFLQQPDIVSVLKESGKKKRKIFINISLVAILGIIIFGAILFDATPGRSATNGVIILAAFVIVNVLLYIGVVFQLFPNLIDVTFTFGSLKTSIANMCTNALQALILFGLKNLLTSIIFPDRLAILASAMMVIKVDPEMKMLLERVQAHRTEFPYERQIVIHIRD